MPALESTHLAHVCDEEAELLAVPVLVEHDGGQAPDGGGALALAKGLEKGNEGEEDQLRVLLRNREGLKTRF